MEGKDNRSINKRKMMKQMKRKSGQNTTSSSTPPPRGVADVADSSDDRFVRGNRWRPMQQGRCYELDELDVLDDDNILNDEQRAQMQAGDFTAMSQVPTAISGHFKFASEKNWDAANDADTELLKNTEAGEYFTLNLKLLNAGLKTIPFHKRMDYPSSMFTNQELSAMDKSAEEAEKAYQHVLHGTDNNPIINILNGSARTGSAKSEKPGKDTLAVNEVTTATEAQNVTENTQSPAPTTGANNDIQDWLDNVLDEGN